MQFLDFPIEILHEIVEHVDAAQDILSLGLTCTRLKDVTIPFPLVYRELIWPTHDGTWRPGSTAAKDPNPFGELGLALEDFLSAVPNRWGAIRGVSFYNTGAYEAPRFMQDYVRSEGFELPKLDDAIYETMMAPAQNPHEIVQRANARHLLMADNVARILVRMPWLSYIAWRWFPPDLDSGIWRVLDGMTQLRKLSFVFNTDSTHGFHGNSALSAIIARLVQAISNCKLLENLTINVPIARNGHHDPTWSFEPVYDVTWPSLRQLDVSNPRISSAQKLITFLSRHTQLSHLRISDSIMPSIRVKAEQLPHLSNVDVPNFKFAKTLVDTKPSPDQPDRRPVYGLRIQSPMSRPDFTALCSVLPSIGSTLTCLVLSLNSTVETDITTVVSNAPNLVNLEITGHQVMDVLQAARRLRAKQTLAPVNTGPMRDWRNIRFPLAVTKDMDRWATCFRTAPQLRTMLLRCLAGLPSHQKPSMYDEEQSVTLEDFISPLVPGVTRVRSQVMQGRDLGLLITCYRKPHDMVKENWEHRQPVR